MASASSSIIASGIKTLFMSPDHRNKPPNHAFFKKLKEANREIHRIGPTSFEQMIDYMNRMNKVMGIKPETDESEQWAYGHLKYKAWTRHIQERKAKRERAR